MLAQFLEWKGDVLLMGSFARTLADVVFGSFASAVGSTVANALGNLLIQVGLGRAGFVNDLLHFHI